MNNDFLEKRLKELSKLNFFNDLVINRGIEKEFFRVNRKGNISEREHPQSCLLYTSPSPRDLSSSRMPSSA